MKQHYTLAQDYISNANKTIGQYLTEQGIEFQIGADLAGDLVHTSGYINNTDNSSHLVSRYTALLDEHELTAIKMAVDGVQIINNSPYVQRKNKVRGMFSWFVE